MKPLLALLALSLAANAVLLISRRSASQADIATAAPSSTASAASSSKGAGASSTEPASTTASVPPGPYNTLWEKLRSGDPAIVAQLRAAGWPEDAIRAFVISMVNDAYRDREQALRSGGPDRQEYWNQASFSGSLAPEKRKALRDLSREKSSLIKSLLGPDYAPESNWQDNRYARFTPAQAENLRMIEDDYSVLAAEIRGNNSFGPTVLLPEDREKMIFLEKERMADIAKVLSPSELLEYEIRHSTTASLLRNHLTAFRPSEAEFRALFPISKALMEKAGPIMGMTSASQRETQTQAILALDAEAKKILSPDRFAEYTRAKDFEYRRLTQLTERLQLPAETAIAAYEVKADIEKRSREIRPSGPDGMKTYQAARAALAAEAEKRLVESLGQRGYEAYKINGAFWLNNLVPPTTPAR